MRIHIVGGGPAGLYLAILTKQHNPDARVTVWERNPRHNTFGWGVVFSEKTLSKLEGPDPVSFERLMPQLERWTDLDVVHRGEKVSIGGNRFCGVARIQLLRILQGRAEELGVELRFQQEVTAVGPLEACDLLVGADGVRSVVREHFAHAFGPQVRLEANPYIWYGTPHRFHGLTLTFRPTPFGLFMAHSYKYGPEGSTFIVECAPQTLANAPFDPDDEPASRAFLEGVFQADLEGQPLQSNNSQWIRFATISNRQWHHRHVVLVGDALHTAHFSIGSGTKLALESALVLHQALVEHGGIEGGLAAFEHQRRPAVERMQQAAVDSLQWFEQAEEDLHLDPVRFAYRAMTRSSKVDHENLRLRDPGFVARYEAACAAAGLPPC